MTTNKAQAIGKGASVPLYIDGPTIDGLNTAMTKLKLSRSALMRLALIKLFKEVETGSVHIPTGGTL